MTTVQDNPFKSKTLIAAGIYNLIYGAYLVLFPNHFFTIIGIELPRYIEFWQCIGMIVGVYGLGYLLAARDPNKHYPIVLVGFLGKVFGPIGFIGALIKQTLPVQFGYMIIFNDLIWWLPFFLLLKSAYKEHQFKA